MLSSLFDSFAWLLNNWWYFYAPALAGALIWVLFGKGTFGRAAKFFIYTSVFSIVIVMTSTFFPFIGGKDYFFRISIELATIFYLLHLIFESRGGIVEDIKEVYKKPLFVAVSIFALVFLLSSVFALDPDAGFWSNFERGEGGFQMIHYYALFALLVILFKTEEDWRGIFKASAAAAVLMIVYGIIANLGLAENFIGPSDINSLSGLDRLIRPRFQGSLGNPAYVSPYLLFSMFYGLYLFIGSKNRRQMFIWGGLTTLFFFFFLFGQARATFVGLSFGILALVLYLIVSVPRWRKWFSAAFVILVLIGSLGLYYKDSSFVKSLPGGRVFDISFETRELNTRFWTWGSAWKGFLERPILGWGPENFSAVFDKYFDPRHFTPGVNTETWFDRAHSAYFDYLAETGALGLLSYFGILASFFWLFVKKGASAQLQAQGGRGENELKERIVKGLVLAIAVGYTVQNLAIFEVLPMYINLFIFLAFSYYYFYRRSPAKNSVK